jgi:2-octaprenyl-6-methoxyphenol hydroxylase
VAALAEVLAEARRRGEDIGAPMVLDRYQRWRRFDAISLGAVTDGLNRLFSTAASPLRLLRDAGLGAVNAWPGLKRRIMAAAAGAEGDLPRLLRGEAP